LHTLPSLQEVPFSTGVLTQPTSASQVSVVQTLLSLQLSGVPAAQTPVWQVSLPLHTLPSVHDEPFATAVFVQPLTGLQPSVVQTLLSLQSSGVPAVHTPLWQRSSPLQTLASAHDEPLGTGAAWQPRVGLQLSVVHTLPSLQTGGAPAVQTPARQVSSPLQRLPSAHEEPFGSSGFPQTPSIHTSLVHGLPSAQSEPTTQDSQPGMGVFWQPVTGAQVSVVQAFASLQLSGAPAVQNPLWQVSLPLHTLPSLQEVPFSTGVFWQPKTGSQVSVVHTLLSLQLSGVPAVQRPAWQVSLPLHTLPSLQEVPFSTAVLVQPLTGLQPSVVHTLPSLQLSAVPAVQVPAWQVSLPLHTLPSGHAVPFSTAVWVQPKAESQLSAVQTLLSLQLSAVPAVHTPLWQDSLPLHTLPSLQEVPFNTGMFWQPATGSQLSAVQTLLSLQLSAVPGVHTPLWQVSLPLQVLPSPHAVPLATAEFRQPVTGLQVSVVQTLPSLQLSAVPVVHTPAWQVSSPLHTLPSVHDEPFGTGAFWQPAMGSQVSVVQTFASLQLRGVPVVHTPAWQVSLPLHTLPSAQGEPLTRSGLLQTPAVHTSLVQGLPSAQSEPTTQGAQPGMGVFWHPVRGAHESVVQALPSLQLSGAPAVQKPLWQVSVPLQTLASAHEVPFSTGVLSQPKTGSQVSVVQTLLSLQLSAVPAVQDPL